MGAQGDLLDSVQHSFTMGSPQAAGKLLLYAWSISCRPVLTLVAAVLHFFLAPPSHKGYASFLSFLKGFVKGLY